MKRTLLALAFVAAAPLFAQTDAHKLVARINGEEITRGELDTLWDRMPQNFRDQYLTVGGKKAFLENYVIGKRLVVQEALRQGFAEKAGVTVDDLDAKAESKVFDRYVRDVIAVPMVTEEAMREVYDERIDEFRIPDQAKLRLIRVAKNDNPDAARDRISKAMMEIFSVRTALAAAKVPAEERPAALANKFSEVAARVSEDPSAVNGGQLGWVALQSLGALAESAKTMHLGTVSGILDLDDSFALVFVEERYTEGTAPYEASKDIIREYVLAKMSKGEVMKAVARKTAELRAAGKVEIFAENLN